MAGREWSDEQREAARQRAKAQGFGGRTASVEEHPIPPVRSADVFIAEHAGRSDRTVEQSQDEDGNPVKTTHSRPGTIIMYKPLEHGGYEPRRASVTAISMLLGQGWAENCPECGKKHIDKNGRESSDPNLCSARPAVAVILCPVCRLRIYDNMYYDDMPAAGDDDKNVIVVDDLKDSTPEQRLVAARNLHMWMHHPRSAQERNLPPLPSALRDMVQEVRQP